MRDRSGGAVDPIDDYLDGLRLLDEVADDVDVLVPGHGSVGGAGQMRARIERDRAYVRGLRDADGPADPRVGPSARFGAEWLPGVHQRQMQRLGGKKGGNTSLGGESDGVLYYFTGPGRPSVSEAYTCNPYLPPP